MGQASYAVKSDLAPEDPEFGKERRCGPLVVGPTPSEAKAYAEAKRLAAQTEELLQKDAQRGESDDVTRLNEEIARLKQEKEADAETIRQQRELIASIQSGDQARVEEELRNQFSQMQQRLEGSMSAMKAEKAALQEEFAALQTSLQTATAAIQKLEVEKEELRQKAVSAVSEYAAAQREQVSRKATEHIPSEEQVEMSQEQLMEQMRSLEAMHDALQRDFGRSQQEARQLEEALTETRGLYHSKSQEKIEIEQKLREHEESATQIERRLGDEIQRVKALQESQAKKFMDLCKFWGDVNYTVSKKNQTFRVKDPKGVVLELSIEPKDYTLRDLIDAVNAVYRTRMGAQIASRKSTIN